MRGAKSLFGQYGDSIYYEIHGSGYLFNGRTGFLEYDISVDDEELLERLKNPENQDSYVGLPLHTDIESGAFHPRTRTFTVYISSVCNMHCSYCQNSGGTFGGSEKIMSRDTAGKLIPFFERHLREANRKSIGINLFGGEPMLNPGAVLEILDALASWKGDKTKIFNAILHTNGTIGNDEVLRAIREIGENVVVSISIDGGQKRHDTYRRLNNGGNSWHRVYEFTQRLRQEKIPFTVLAVVPYPYEFRETAEEMIELGFDVFEIKDIVPISYGGMGNTEIFRFDPLLWREKFLEYIDFSLDLSRSGSRIHLLDRENIHRFFTRRYRERSVLFCELLLWKAAVDTTGGIYPCEFLVQSDFILGNVEDGWDAQKLARFIQILDKDGLMKANRPECMNCFARVLCSGDCYAESWQRTGRISDIRTERCEYFKERVKIELYYLSEMQKLGQ